MSGGSISGSNRFSNERLHAINENEFVNDSPTLSIKNSVQAQIEKMFTDIAKDDPSAVANCFSIKYLGSLPLIGKVTSLLGLQDPLRQLYLSGAGHGVSYCNLKAPKKLKTVRNLCGHSSRFPYCFNSLTNYVTQMYDVLEIPARKKM